MLLQFKKFLSFLWTNSAMVFLPSERFGIILSDACPDDDLPEHDLSQIKTTHCSHSTLFHTLCTPVPANTSPKVILFLDTIFLKFAHVNPFESNFWHSFFKNSPYFRFDGPFPVYISFNSRKSQIRPIFTYCSSKWSVRPKHNLKKNILVWGQILNLGSFWVKFRTSSKEGFERIFLLL